MESTLHSQRNPFSQNTLCPEMQEIHSIGGGDRRLGLHHHHHHLPLICPRCDSPNTKFCYYNNYNLSQPRHFCKNCRRYWTKGGVLRDVPVGGGCRKSKRSNNPSSSSDTPLVTPLPPSEPPTEPEPNSNSHSSSESSTLAVAATEAMSPPTSNALLLDNNVRYSKSGAIFSDSDCFNALINSNNEPLGFGFNNMLDTRQEFGTASFLDHTVPLQFSSSLQHKSGFGSLDWQPSLFDLPNTVDQPYCSHTRSSHQDNNPSLFHLP